MRFIVLIALIFIASCKNTSESTNRNQKIHDSIVASVQESYRYQKYSDSLYKIKITDLKKLRNKIPLDESYYGWSKATPQNGIYYDQSDSSHNEIWISETTAYNLNLSHETYGGQTRGSYQIYDVENRNKYILFKTISQKQKDTVFWKFQFTNKNILANWSLKRTNETKFTSLGNYFPCIEVAKAIAKRDSIVYAKRQNNIN